MLCSKLSSLSHPNIVAFQNLFLTQNYVGMQLQLANGGNVTTARTSFRDSYGNGDKLLMGSTDEFALQVFQQLIVAIEFCHRNNIIIRDVKPENILIDWVDVPGHGTTVRKYPVVRLADFGLSKDVGAAVRYSLSPMCSNFCSLSVITEFHHEIESHVFSTRKA